MARHSISELPATRRPLRIGGLINTYLRRAMPNYGRLDLHFSLSGSQSLHGDSCKTFLSGQLSATLLSLPPTGSAGSLSERGQASPPSLCVAGGLEGRFLRALCLVNQSARPLCSRSPLRFPCPSPSPGMAALNSLPARSNPQCSTTPEWLEAPGGPLQNLDSW